MDILGDLIDSDLFHFGAEIETTIGIIAEDHLRVTLCLLAYMRWRR
jgi:hypothetical protein